MSEMRKLMEAVQNMDSSEIEHVSYAAAKYYLESGRGSTKDGIAKKLSDETGVEYNIAVLMIEAIDAYEDTRESYDINLT